MSPTTTSRRRRARPVARVLDLYRDRLISHSGAFTLATLALARSTSGGGSSINQPSPERTAALAALDRWQADVHHARSRMRGVPFKSVGQALALQWLNTLNTALDHFKQSLVLVDAQAAADAARLARQGIDEAHRLADRLAAAIA